MTDHEMQVIIEHTIDPAQRASWRAEYERSKGVVETPQAQAGSIAEVQARIAAFCEENGIPLAKSAPSLPAGDGEEHTPLSQDQLKKAGADIADYLGSAEVKQADKQTPAKEPP